MLDRITRLIENHHENVEKGGRSVQYVFADEEQNVPPFAYSVGFAKSGWPDLYIVGAINPKTLVYIINEIYNLWEKEGYSLGEKKRILSEDFGVMLLPVYDTEQLDVNVNSLYYKTYPENYRLSGNLPTFVQVLWPDTQGKYPTDKAFDTRFVQPVFATPLN